MLDKTWQYIPHIPFGLQTVMKDNNGARACCSDRALQTPFRRQSPGIVICQHIPHDYFIITQGFDLVTCNSTVGWTKEKRMQIRSVIGNRCRKISFDLFFTKFDVVEVGLSACFPAAQVVESVIGNNVVCRDRSSQ